MKLSLIAVILAACTSLLPGQVYLQKTVNVGDTTVTLPVPNKYVQLERNMPFASDFFAKKEHVFSDETKNNTFIAVAISPEKFSEAGRTGRLTGSIDCWAMYGNTISTQRINLGQFTKLVSEIEKSINAAPAKGSAADIYGITTSSIRDAESRRRIEAMEKPLIISKSARSIVTMTKLNEEYILNGNCMINGKLIFIYIQKSNPFDDIEEMEAWVKEIEAQTNAEFLGSASPLDSGWITAATVLGLFFVSVAAIAAVIFAFKTREPKA